MDEHRYPTKDDFTTKRKFMSFNLAINPHGINIRYNGELIIHYSRHCNDYRMGSHGAIQHTPLGVLMLVSGSGGSSYTWNYVDYADIGFDSISKSLIEQAMVKHADMVKSVEAVLAQLSTCPMNLIGFDTASDQHAK